jgi:KDO2-lipid IV(A) lauroyltransferase
MHENRPSLIYYPGYLLFVGISNFLRILPTGLVWRIFSAASRLTYMFDGRHRRLALHNLDIAFGSTKTAEEKKRIARESFKNLFLTVAEFLLIPKLIDTVDDLITLKNPELIKKEINKERGVIFLVSHFGNWEIMAHTCMRNGFKLASVGRPLKNPLVYGEIERLRCLNGGVALKKKWVARDIMKKLRDGWCVAILFDQYAGRYAPFVPFFGRPVSTTPAIALLAMKTGVAVMPVFNVREGYGKNTVYVCEPVEIANTGNREKDIEVNCARFNGVLEQWVRKMPGHWMWMHRRWRKKKRPDEP